MGYFRLLVADNIDDEQTRNEIANLLFSEDGLNLDTYRYCLYGGYDPENNVVDSQWRLGESFMFIILKRANMSMTGHEMQIHRLCFRRRLTEV